jgi:hypothetical protein
VTHAQLARAFEYLAGVPMKKAKAR